MRGGAIPPGEKWLNRLPLIVWSEAAIGTDMIYRPKVQEWKNLVVRKVAENRMTLVKDEGSNSWRFDEWTNSFAHDASMNTATSSSVVTEIIQELGLEGVSYASREVANPTKQDIIGSLVQSV